jgi:hypothetical protein
MKTLSNTANLRVLNLDEIDIVSGAKPKQPKILGVVTERCESYYKGDKKISVCTPVN